MTDPPRALKRVKKGEPEESEIEIFRRPDVLTYQNKALASLLSTEKTNGDKLKKELAKIEQKCSNLASCSALLSQQLFAINDKIHSLSKVKCIELSPEKDLRSASSKFALFENFVNNIDQFSKPDFDFKEQIGDAGFKLISMIECI